MNKKLREVTHQATAFAEELREILTNRNPT
jgi:hypothetical protein